MPPSDESLAHWILLNFSDVLSCHFHCESTYNSGNSHHGSRWPDLLTFLICAEEAFHKPIQQVTVTCMAPVQLLKETSSLDAVRGDISKSNLVFAKGGLVCWGKRWSLIVNNHSNASSHKWNRAPYCAAAPYCLLSLEQALIAITSASGKVIGGRVWNLILPRQNARNAPEMRLKSGRKFIDDNAIASDFPGWKSQSLNMNQGNKGQVMCM